MTRVYLSAPITGTTDYASRFKTAEDIINEYKGFECINPAKVNGELPKSFSHNEYMHISRVLIEFCGAIVLLNGWEKSKGCREEVDMAILLDMMIFDGIDSFRRYAEQESKTD